MLNILVLFLFFLFFFENPAKYIDINVHKTLQWGAIDEGNLEIKVDGLTTLRPYKPSYELKALIFLLAYVTLYIRTLKRLN